MNAPVRTASLGNPVRSKARSDNSSNTALEMPHPVPKSVLSHVGRQALSDLNSTPLPGTRVLGGKTQSAELCASSLQQAVSSDGAEPRGVVAVHSAVASTCLHKLSPQCAVPVLSSVTESPDEKALLNMSVEGMHLPLDCSEDSYVLPDEDSLGVIGDGSDHSLSPPHAPGAEAFGPGLPGLAGAGMNMVEPMMSTPEGRELTPEAAVSDLELTDEEDAANVSDIEEMHPHDDDENFFDVPDEFKLDDKHLAILRDVCGVAWHQKHEAAPATPSTPPEFALPIVPTIADCRLMEDYVYLESLEKPIVGPLEFVPLE